MYSAEIEKAIRSAGAKAGDMIRITEGDETFEGILIPRSEAGDPAALILKLQNGYNIGIKFSGSMKIERIKPGSSFSFPKSALKFSGHEKIGLIYTGGTIGSKVDYTTGGVHMATKPEELLYEIPELSVIADIKVNNLMSIASDDMTYKEWQMIANAVKDAFADGARGVIITHGTDTMHYTSAALSFMLTNLPGPVILTGAQRSPDRGSSDAFMNLICASHFSTKGLAAEISICMHRGTSDDYCTIIRGTRARKMHTSRRDAFKDVGGGTIADVRIDGEIDYIGRYQGASEAKLELKAKFEPKVALVKIYPNSDPDILKYYSEKGYKGIILEATGLGHLPVSTVHKEFNWLQAVNEAVDKGMVIGVSSQCIYGRVNPRVYKNARMLNDAGVIYCEDMMPEVAYVKLGFLLGNYKPDKSAEMLCKNIAGEITERSEIRLGSDAR